MSENQEADVISDKQRTSERWKLGVSLPKKFESRIYKIIGLSLMTGQKITQSQIVEAALEDYLTKVGV